MKKSRTVKFPPPISAIIFHFLTEKNMQQGCSLAVNIRVNGDVLISNVIRLVHAAAETGSVV